MAKGKLVVSKVEQREATGAAFAKDDSSLFMWCRLTCSRWSNVTAVTHRKILSATYFQPLEDAWLTARAALQRITLPFPGSELRLLAAEDVFRIRPWNQILPEAIHALAKGWDEAWQDAGRRLGASLRFSDIISLDEFRELHKVELAFEPAEACPNGDTAITAANICDSLSSLR